MNKENLIQMLKQQGFSRQILSAFSKTKREDFIPSNAKNQAYEDKPLSIDYKQTISQPYTIAIMLSLLNLKENQKVLEIGSGSGYVLALINKIIGKKGKIYGVERIKQLSTKSQKVLSKYKNIKVYNKNGIGGLKQHAPFDRILISAACQEIPKALFSQLKEKGLIVAPVTKYYDQSLVVIKKTKNKLVIQKQIPGFIFVPFVED